MKSEGTASTGEAFWAVRRLFEGLARRQPLLVVLEDIHWAEPTLLELIEYLGTWISEAPVLVLCLARPELLEKRPGWGAQAETILLDPLSEDEAHTLVGELAGAIGVSDEVRSRIVEAAEGNALFVEQLHAYVTEDVGAEELESVPPSIEALLASRLDRLEPSERTLLERAAIVGKDFRRAAVLQLSPPEELAGLDSGFRSLERKGLVHAVRPTALEEETLRFHHVLIRDVAYAGVTKELRADLHERHAAWLDQRSESDELVGYHVEQAHRYLAELRPGDAAVPAACRLGRREARGRGNPRVEAGGHVCDRQPAGPSRRALAGREPRPSRAALRARDRATVAGRLPAARRDPRRGDRSRLGDA